MSIYMPTCRYICLCIYSYIIFSNYRYLGNEQYFNPWLGHLQITQVSFLFWARSVRLRHFRLYAASSHGSVEQNPLVVKGWDLQDQFLSRKYCLAKNYYAVCTNTKLDQVIRLVTKKEKKNYKNKLKCVKIMAKEERKSFFRWYW